MASSDGLTGQGKPDIKPEDAPGIKADILDRRNESRRYMQINYWDMWEDVYRASKCRTKPIMTKDKAGNEVEDKTRTNVAMPELSLIVRRKTARLTANPPQINYTVPNGGDEELADKLTAWAYQQFDRSGEMQEHRKLVQSSNIFGWGVSKLYWDTVEVERKFFRSFTSPGTPYGATRDDLMNLQSSAGDESPADKMGGTELSDSERAQAMAKFGSAAQVPVRATQFEGPVSKHVFIGDFFMEPGAASLNVSGWAIENYFETDVWLEKMSKKTYIVPGTDDELPIFDPKAIRELQDMPSWQPIYQQQPFDLRARLRTNAQGQTLPLWPTKLLKGKRYDVLECHTRDKYGQFWIEWLGNEKVLLGRMPYPWDLYGKYCYTEFVPLFDLLAAYGDSTPLLLRHMWLLHNAIAGSRRDLVANVLRPLLKAKAGADIPDEQVDRALFRIIFMRDPNDLQPLIEPMSIMPAISAANEEEAQCLRMIGLAEPNLTNVETGTDVNPQAGKTATTAMLSAKSADALTQFEIDSLSFYLKESGEKKLAMLQQTEPDTDESGEYKPIGLSPKYTGMVKGFTERYGKAQEVSLSFLEIQQEIQVEPEAMSMLSVDDDIRRQSAMQLAQMAAQAPGIVDPVYAAKFYASTIRGVDPDKAVPPPQPPQPPPPKVSVAIAVKWPELPSEVQVDLLQGAGAQLSPETIKELQMHDTMKGIQTLSDTADAADNLMSNPDQERQEELAAASNGSSAAIRSNKRPPPASRS